MNKFINLITLKVFLALFLVVTLNSCQEPTSSMKSFSNVPTYAYFPSDFRNPQDWVGNMHNSALDYLIIHDASPSNIYEAADTMFNFLRDSVALSNCTQHHFADTASTSWRVHDFQTWNTIGYANGTITSAQKTQLDYIANLFDSSDVYDSTTFIHRVYQVEIGINNALFDSARSNVQIVIAIGKASWYYWNYQLNNQSTTLWTLGTRSKGANPASLGHKTKPLINAIIKADLVAAAASVTSSIGVAVVAIMTGVGAAPALSAVAIKAVTAAIITSGLFAIFG